MSNPSPKTDHLTQTQWKPGQSGNPAGKPKGTKHLSTLIREMLDDDNFVQKLENGKLIMGAPGKAIVRVLVVKSLNGDLKAFDLLAKYGYGTKLEIESDSLPMPIPILGGASVFPVRAVNQMSTTSSQQVM